MKYIHVECYDCKTAYKMNINKIASLCKECGSGRVIPIKVVPKLTAIHRNKPSLPLQKIINKFSKDNSILDYGCGYGFDVAHLQENGFNAIGYDKYIDSIYNIYTAGNDIKFDIVTCFYVLNVILDKEERTSILTKIKISTHSKSSIYISVRSFDGLQKNQRVYRKVGDGIVTSRNTFQKYFKYDEILELLKSVFNDYSIEEIKVNKSTHLFHVYKK